MAAMYIDIKNDILEKINSGIYEEGNVIPTELELADFYKVSRPTIRQAVQLLVDDGYLEKRKKRGTIVCKRKIEQEFTQKISSFETEMSEKGLVTDTNVISLKVEYPSDDVCSALSIESSEKVYKLVRLRYIDKKPNVLVTTYIPYELFPELKSVDFKKNRLYDYFSSQGNPVSRIKRKLETIKADETVSDLLDIAIGEPVFYFHSYGYGNGGRIIEYSISKYRGDMNYFVFDLYR
ncbi:GntR family transcriptional regulator [Peptacetobacter hominis]|uniref:GntR family transcriptional regulator n=1 Tax=Peptacetobacter hominis TaxID=2743610 RepID=A0A544QWC3_9FIRM|nr:GntR family transcriptional regulator [Peptacetobacter hominis]TQQ84999.1 GntR family transcriptional regulator [Peptacetobacter hominis]